MSGKKVNLRHQRSQTNGHTTLTRNKREKSPAVGGAFAIYNHGDYSPQ